MFSEKFINKVTNDYIKELKAIGREFNPIKVAVKSRKSVSNFGKIHYTYKKLGYDIIEINQYITSESQLRNTILHELAHADKVSRDALVRTHINSGRAEHHGRHWQHVASIYGKKYGMVLTRTANQEIKVPGQVIVNVVWTDKFYDYNPSFKRGEAYRRKYSSMGYARNFVDKYKKMGYVADVKFLRE